MKETNPLEDIQEIRKMMESSSKFLSLSGLSGVFAGLVALGGAFVAHYMIIDFYKKFNHYTFSGRLTEKAGDLEMNLILIAIGVLAVALGGGIIITSIKARKRGEKMFSSVSMKLAGSVMVPLFFGGVFVIGLYLKQAYLLIPPAMLIFYGMALLNASKYLHPEMKWLALSEMALGCALMFTLKDGLLFWAIGFGVLHILYGAIMWYKYDRKQSFE